MKKGCKTGLSSNALYLLVIILQAYEKKVILYFCVYYITLKWRQMEYLNIQFADIFMKLQEGVITRAWNT